MHQVKLGLRTYAHIIKSGSFVSVPLNSHFYAFGMLKLIEDPLH